MQRQLAARIPPVFDSARSPRVCAPDCVMALWNTPSPVKDHEYRACCAALECEEWMVKRQTLKLRPRAGHSVALELTVVPPGDLVSESLGLYT